MAKYSGPAIENDAGLGQVRRAKRIHYLHKAELPTLRYSLHHSQVSCYVPIIIFTLAGEKIRRSQPI